MECNEYLRLSIRTDHIAILRSELPSKDFVQVIDALIEYTLHGNKPEKTLMTDAAWISFCFISQEIEDYQTDEEICGNG